MIVDNLDSTLDAMVNASMRDWNNSSINTFSGKVNVNPPQMTPYTSGMVTATDPQNMEDVTLKTRAKKEIATSIPYDATPILVEGIQEPSNLREIIRGYEVTNSKIKQTKQNFGTTTNEYPLSPKLYSDLWNEYRNLENAMTQNNRLGNLGLLGRILTNLFKNQEVLNNLTGAGLLSMDDAGIIASLVSDQQIPLDYLTMLNICFYQIADNLLKATAYEANIVASPGNIASDLVDAITKNDNKNDIMRQQLFVLSNHGLIPKENISDYMVRQIPTDEASIVKALASKPIALWSSEDYKYEAQVAHYMRTGQLPATNQAMPTIPVGNATTGHNAPTGAMIFSPDGGFKVSTPNGYASGADAMQFINQYGAPPANPTPVTQTNNGVIVNKTGNNENIAANLINPNPQARVLFNNNNQSGARINGVSGLSNLNAQPQGAQPVNQGFMQQPAVQQYPQPQPNVVNNPVFIPPTTNYAPATPVPTPGLVNANNFMKMPNNEFDISIPDQAILTWNMIGTYNNYIEPNTNSYLLKLENPQNRDVRLVTQKYYEHRRNYLTNVNYKMSYDAFLNGGMSQPTMAPGIMPTYTSPAPIVVQPTAQPTYPAVNNPAVMPQYGVMNQQQQMNPTYVTPPTPVQPTATTGFFGCTSPDPMAQVSQPTYGQPMQAPQMTPGQAFGIQPTTVNQFTQVNPGVGNQAGGFHLAIPGFM